MTLRHEKEEEEEENLHHLNPPCLPHPLGNSCLVHCASLSPYFSSLACKNSSSVGNKSQKNTHQTCAFQQVCKISAPSARASAPGPPRCARSTRLFLFIYFPCFFSFNSNRVDFRSRSFLKLHTFTQREEKKPVQHRHSSALVSIEVHFAVPSIISRALFYPHARSCSGNIPGVLSEVCFLPIFTSFSLLPQCCLHSAYELKKGAKLITRL